MNDTPSDPNNAEPNTTPSPEQEPATHSDAAPQSEQPSLTEKAAAQPEPAQQTPVFGAQKPKRSKRLAAIIGVVGVLVLAGGASAYAFWYQNPERVVNQAIEQLITTDMASTSTRITSDSELATGFMNLKLKEFTVDAAQTEQVSGEMDANLKLELNGRDYAAGGKVRLLEDKTIYFQLVDVKNVVTQIAEDFGGIGISIPAEVETQLEKVENTWVKVTPEDMGSEAEAYNCVMDALKTIGQDDEAEDAMVELYRKHKFVEVNDTVESKNGNLGYNVELNTEALKAFGEDLESQEFTKELAACEDVDEASADAEEQLDEVTGEDDSNMDVVIWVSRFGHELRQVDYTITAKNTMTDADTVFEGETTFDYGDVTVEAPSESVPYTEWSAWIDELSQATVGASSEQMMLGDDMQDTDPVIEPRT